MFDAAEQREAMLWWQSSHTPVHVTVASGAGYIRCSCGWRSKVEDDGDMYEPGRYDAGEAFRNHLKTLDEQP